MHTNFFFFSPFPYVAGFLFGPVSSSASVYNHVRLPMHVLYSTMSVAVLAKVVEASVAEVLVIHLFFAYKLEALFFPLYLFSVHDKFYGHVPRQMYSLPKCQVP